MKNLWKYAVAVPIVIGQDIVQAAEDLTDKTVKLTDKTMEVIDSAMDIAAEKTHNLKILNQYLFSTKEIELD